MTVTAPTDTPAELELSDPSRPVYLDCNATTPAEPRVAKEVLKWTCEEFGNAGSRTHTYGQVAKERVVLARRQVAEVVDAHPDEVVFTSGATESNNLALLGLALFGERNGRKHIISTQIEHKAVLEPLEQLSHRGFEVSLVPPTRGGWVKPDHIRAALRPDTLVVSVMGVNNETGVIQPIEEIASCLSGHEAFLHVDAAQAFGKTIDLLRNPRIDLTSVSGHKIYGPKGIGALIARRRKFNRIPIEPLMFGGGQERGLRPGTLPVALIAGLGMASALAIDEKVSRRKRCQAMQAQALAALKPLGIAVNGDIDRTIAHTLNISVPGVDSEAAIVALKDVAAVSNGSACTSQSYEPSHVLKAAKLPAEQISGALRFSWSHLTPEIDWEGISERLCGLMPAPK
ncbi:putative L-cysteine desulfurase [Mycobacterium sp. MFM001]|uniref:cysteine desulfurase DndA n=1 Tax=Mycobacterium sp. MFM001 TaxID=2049453 RepID=UPI000DA5661E|nr:cysteine desulfurase DndA [Mycobacterium sp. MFM001]GBE65145.1 putative L-cysteine desulfurase [Mycobacterium sp. MFM001]